MAGRPSTVRLRFGAMSMPGTAVTTGALARIPRCEGRSPPGLAGVDEGGDSDGGLDAGNEAARARRTRTGAFITEARLAYSSVLLESSKWVPPG